MQKITSVVFTEIGYEVENLFLNGFDAEQIKQFLDKNIYTIKK